MELINITPIGIDFNIDNIFLATIKDMPKQDTLKSLEEKDIDINDENLVEVVSMGFISTEQVDIFYRTRFGYVRYSDEGPELFVGDNSDGKGTICNIVPILDYYNEEQIGEATYGNSRIIVVDDIEPLRKYNNDYNA